MIRPFVETEDLGRCVALFRRVFNHAPWNDNWTLQSAEGYLIDFIKTPGFRGFVAEEESMIKGFIFGFRKRWWEGDEFYIHEMCVEITGQRNGIGTKLIQYLESRLGSEGVHAITLLTNRGIPAEAFYKKNGFNEVERIIFLHKKIE